MASFECVGFIRSVKYLPESVIVFIDEFKKGYKKADGTVVEDRYLTFKTVCGKYFKKYISEHFSNGMLVQVKGDVYPYAVEQGKMLDGYSVIGQAINLFSYPRASVRQEQKMIRESQASSMGTPDLEAYSEPDF